MNQKQDTTKLYIIWLIGCLIGYLCNTLTHSHKLPDLLLFVACPVLLQIVTLCCMMAARRKENVALYGLFASLILLIPAIALYMIQSAELVLLLPLTYAVLGMFDIGKQKLPSNRVPILLLLTLIVKSCRWGAFKGNPKPTLLFPELILFMLTVGAMMYVFYRKMKDQQTVTEMYEEAKEAMNIDGLTGLLNRKGMEGHIASCQKKATVFSVIMMDIDNFKKVNDTYGHTFGDIVLKGLADTLTSNTRCSDTVFRYGGEEFIIVCSNTTRDQAVLVAEKVRKAFKATAFLYDNEPLNFTISLGVAECTYKQYKDVKSLVDVADHNLYEAKHTGKDRVVG